MCGFVGMYVWVCICVVCMCRWVCMYLSVDVRMCVWLSVSLCMSVCVLSVYVY